MKPIIMEEVQKTIDSFSNQELYIHLETTAGAYAAHNSGNYTVGAYIRNGKINFSHGKITGVGPHRVGLKTETGWIFAEGITDWELDGDNRLLLAGHDSEGRIALALQLSKTPF